MEKEAREFRQLQSECLQVDEPERLSFHSWLSPLLVSGLVFALGEARDQPHFKKNSRGLPFQSPQKKKTTPKTAIARPWPSFASILLKPKVHNRPRPTIASAPPLAKTLQANPNATSLSCLVFSHTSNVCDLHSCPTNTTENPPL
uniref:Uncharacterized protein n=1 Tax=Micrurus lemniscatus lemniscatus TaxID=129467 RepID=A0A2D4HGE5_MICLE